MVYAAFFIMAAIIVFCFIKIFIMKSAMKEMALSFGEILCTDTNALIRVTSRDRDIIRLTQGINGQLRILRNEYLKYHQGNTELITSVTNISHDLRTPLTVVCGYLDMIKRTGDPEKVKRYLSVISERTELMKRLTEELFSYSLIISKQSGTPNEEVFVNRLLEETISGFYPELSEKGVTPKINITRNKIMKTVNKADLARVFSNLLNNAVKYSDGDLSITLTDNGTVVFENTASGLSGIQIEQLFDRFFTVETARNSTGLGLSIVKTLVERMGGSIAADFEENTLRIVISL